MLKYQCKILEKMLESCLNLWTKNVWEPCENLRDFINSRLVHGSNIIATYIHNLKFNSTIFWNLPNGRVLKLVHFWNFVELEVILYETVLKINEENINLKLTKAKV